MGVRHYGNIREEAKYWLEQVEIDINRMDHFPDTFSGGMQQRLQLARVLVTKPRLIFMIVKAKSYIWLVSTLISACGDRAEHFFKATRLLNL